MALFGGVDSVHTQLTLDASVEVSDHWNLACCGGEAVWNKTEPCAGSVPFLPPPDPAPNDEPERDRQFASQCCRAWGRRSMERRG
jgi:hypothetical protein